MKIILNEVEHLVPAEEEFVLLRQVEAMLLEEYAKLDQKWRLLSKPIAREVLRRMEDEVRKKHGDEKALLLRPAKQEDPCIHLSGVMLAILQEALKYVSFSIQTTDTLVSGLSVSIENQGQVGRQVVTYGNNGKREDNSTQVP